MIEYLRNVSGALRFISNDRIKVNDFADSLSNTQFESKKWLVESLVKLNIKPKKIVILGGWYGSYLVPMLNEAFQPSYISLTDFFFPTRHPFFFSANDYRMQGFRLQEARVPAPGW